MDLVGEAMGGEWMGSSCFVGEVGLMRERSMAAKISFGSRTLRFGVAEAMVVVEVEVSASSREVPRNYLDSGEARQARASSIKWGMIEFVNKASRWDMCYIIFLL